MATEAPADSSGIAANCAALFRLPLHPPRSRPAAYRSWFAPTFLRSVIARGDTLTPRLLTALRFRSRYLVSLRRLLGGSAYRGIEQAPSSDPAPRRTLFRSSYAPSFPGEAPLLPAGSLRGIGARPRIHPNSTSCSPLSLLILTRLRLSDLGPLGSPSCCYPFRPLTPEPSGP